MYRSLSHCFFLIRCRSYTTKSFLVVILLFLTGCIGSARVYSPEEALQKTAERIDRAIREWQETKAFQRIEFPSKPTQDPQRVAFWYYTHPLIAPALTIPERKQKFETQHPDVHLDAQFIGEWFYAIQKLTVSLAADDLPDVALVKQEWLGALVESGRVAPLDIVLDENLLKDIPESVRTAYSVQGMMYALPADGFCSVMYCNREILKDLDPPKTWEELRRIADQLRRGRPEKDFHPIGYLPFMEMFWSAGGEISFEKTSGCLDEEHALDTLRFLLALRTEELMYPRPLSDESAGLELFARGRVAMTVASSRFLPQCKTLPFEISLAPLPGKNGPISRLSDNVLIVFSDYAESKKRPIASLLEFLTGPEVQGASSLELGAVPIRSTMRKEVNIQSGLLEAFAVARSAPLVRPWGMVEDELRRMVTLVGL